MTMATVKLETEGELNFGPQECLLLLPEEIGTEPFNVTVTLNGTWSGREKIIERPKVYIHHVKMDNFAGSLKVEPVDASEKPAIVVELIVDKGILHEKEGIKKNKFFLLLKVKTLTIVEPETGWPEDIYGPEPNIIIINNGKIIFGSENEEEVKAAPGLSNMLSTSWARIKSR
jgi:hypothetical protein